MAPTGVLSSWLTLATKSRRTSSIRRSRVRSSTRASTRRLPSGATRAVTWRAGSPVRPMTSSTSRIWPSRRTCAITEPSSGLTTWDPRTRPNAYAGADALTTRSASSTTTELLRRTDRTAATSGRNGGRLDLEGDVLLAVADVPGEHRAAGDDGADDRGEERLERRIHVAMVLPGETGLDALRARLRNVHPAFTRPPRLVVLAA